MSIEKRKAMELNSLIAYFYFMMSSAFLRLSSKVQ